MDNEASKPESTGSVLRDSKGRFVSEKGEQKPTEDLTTVKIRVVKEKKPKPPKSIAGKLNDLKERNASKFIDSVIVHNPDRVSFDGRYYYSQGVVDSLKVKLGAAIKKAVELENEAKEVEKDIDTIEKAVDVMVQDNDELLETNKTLLTSKNKWRALAIGLIIGLVASMIMRGCNSYVKERNLDKALLSTGWQG